MNKVDIVKPVSSIEAEPDLEDTVPPPLMTPIVNKNEDSSDEEEEPEAVDADVSDESGTENEKQVRFAGPDAKIMRAIKNLSGVSYNPVPDKIIQSGSTRSTRLLDAKLGRAR